MPGILIRKVSGHPEESFFKNCFLLRSDAATSIKEFHELAGLGKSTMLIYLWYLDRSIYRRKKYRKLQKPLNEDTKIHLKYMSIKELVNINSGEALDDDRKYT